MELKHFPVSRIRFQCSEQSRSVHLKLPTSTSEVGG